MTITGTTRLYPLVGHPVTQVRTPPAINAWLADQAQDAVMVPADILPGRITAFFEMLRDWPNCGGCSVTIPHKQAAFRAMDRLTERARQIGAVNIIRRDGDGSLSGDMTDGLAFVAALRQSACDPAGKTALLAGGGGGAGLAIALALAEAGIARLCLLEPDAERRARAMGILRDAYPALKLNTDPGPGGFDIGVNASPLGMAPDDPMAFDPALIRPDGLAGDVVTKPPLTPLLLAAQKRGLAIVTGIAMADAQLPFQMRHLGLWRDTPFN